MSAPTPPRPPAAFGVVAISAAALALTGQLDAPACIAHALAFLAALRFRSAPRAWQRSAWLLNAGLLASFLYCGALWMRGTLALVALAHFAHLAQALQLLDARPRRSDFLLVALALFQMILAANLTDSVFFPPLLFAFVLAVVWTLLIHTLWMEAIESGQRWQPRQALTPGLVRTTLVASGASIALALAIFLVLPRARAGALVGGGALGAPAAGFSSRISLGELGRIRSDSSTVLRVETVRGTPPPAELAYWRGLAFDRFDGRSWSVTPPGREILSKTPDLGVDVTAALETELVQRVLRDPVDSGVLFGSGRVGRVEGSVGRVERDRNGGLYAPESVDDRVQYFVETAPAPARAALAGERAVPPSPDGDRYLALPELAAGVEALARRVTSGAATDAERAAAIEAHLRAVGRYTDDPPPLSADGERSPVEAFLLGETRGHCEYFASGMVVLARSLGLPARLVNGFAGGRVNEVGGFVELVRADAHAWVEVHFERAGWVRYDPTPPDLRMRAAPVDWLARLADYGSAVEHWWYQHVVEFDRSHQMRALRSGWLAWREWRRETGAPAPAAQRPQPRSGAPTLPRPDPAVAAGLLLGGAGLLWGWRRRRRRGPAMPAAYAQALRLIQQRRGLERGAAVAARDFAREAARALPPAAAAAFWSLTESYLAERFGGRRRAGGADALRALRDSLRE
ncbi:MAG: DUF3488 and transglutaminase-like domain-containing protein [Myxococcota bacterium]|nr:DUF3488 and transglutaminase-like domain-containing protein [Myxococcota bacterium]